MLDRWFELLEARDEPRDRYMIATRRAALELLAGQTDRAEAQMDRAARIGERIHEPDVGNVFMSQRVALAHARNHPDELRSLASDAVAWWTGAPVLAHAVAAGAYATAGDLEAAEREIAVVAASGGWQSDGSYLRSVLVTHLAEAAAACGDLDLCRDLLGDLDGIADSCGVNGAVVAFAGPFAHAAGILAGAVNDVPTARAMLQRSIATARRLEAGVWVRRGETVLRDLASSGAGPGQPGPMGPQKRGAADPAHDTARLTRAGDVWNVSWRGESGSLPHVKGLTDIATLVRGRGQHVPALQLMGGLTAVGGREPLVDLEALGAYRRRLDDLGTEIDQAASDADLGVLEHLEAERDRLLLELRRVTGLGGRLRTDATDPAERARKAVSARIRDAIRRLEGVTPLLAAHLDRSIQTGLRCSYTPLGDDDALRWTIEC